MNTDKQITVKDPALGEFILDITESKPIWFGPFQTGKMAIYHAKPVGTTIIPCFGVIAVITEQADDSLNGMTYAMYSLMQPIEFALEHMISQISSNYVNAIMKAKAVNDPIIH